MINGKAGSGRISGVKTVIVPEAQQTCGRLSKNLPKWARDMVLCKQQRLSYNYKEKGFYFMAKSAKLFLSDFIYTVLGMAKTVIK